MSTNQPVHPDPLLEQLRLFNQAAEALTRQWSLTDDDGNHPIVMCDKYPFDESFDEIAHQIHEWYQAALTYQPIDYENLLTARAAQYNTTREVVKRATDAFWFTEGDAATQLDCQQAEAAGATTLEDFIKFFAAAAQKTQGGE
jgi:hypothetical protein